MNQPAKTGALILALSVTGVLTHLLPHGMGFSTVGAISMLAVAFLPRMHAVIPVLLTVFVVDAINGFYGALAMSFVYLGHLGAALAVRPILNSVSGRAVVLASIVNALVFYVISNVTPMAMSFYPATVDGWLLCYVNGLPFLLKGILANLVFGGIAFGAIWLVRESGANRFFAPERH